MFSELISTQKREYVSPAISDAISDFMRIGIWQTYYSSVDLTHNNLSTLIYQVAPYDYMVADLPFIFKGLRAEYICYTQTRLPRLLLWMLFLRLVVHSIFIFKMCGIVHIWFIQDVHHTIRPDDVCRFGRPS